MFESREDMYDVRIIKMLIVETGTYNDAYLRPYTSQYDGRAKRIYDEYTHGGNNIQASTLAGIAGQLVRPVSEAGERVGLPNGWDTRRFRFIIVAECGIPGDHGTPSIEYITGYTDHADISLSGLIDRATRLYFNNSVQARQTRVRRNGEILYQQRLVDASHIIMAPEITESGQSYNGYQRRDVELLTPQDVLGELLKDDYPDDEVVDRRNTMRATTVRKSRRSHGLATDYLTRTIMAVKQADMMESAGNVIGNPEDTRFSLARTFVEEPHYTNDRFLTWLDDNTNYGLDRFISLGEMFRAFEGLETIMEVVPLTTPQRRTLPQRGSHATMNDSTNETIVASIIAAAMPAIMMDLMLTRLTVFMSNETLDGQPEIEVRKGLSIAGGDFDISPYLDAAEARIQHEVFPDISHRNDISLSVFADVDIMGDTTLKISYMGGPDIDYTVPSFADALFAPVISGVGDALSDLASTIRCLTDSEENNEYDDHAPRRSRNRSGVSNDNDDYGRI